MEEVALDDARPHPPQKKRGMFSRLMDSDSHSERPGTQKDDSGKSSWHHFGGRKRGQSGQGAELGSLPQREGTPKAESQLKHEERPSTPPTTSGAENSQAPVENGVF